MTSTMLALVALIGAGRHAAATPVVASRPHRAQEALTEQQRQAREHFAQASRLTQAGDLVAARDAALEGERLDPNNPAGLNLLGHIHASLGDITGAEQAYMRAQQVAPGWVEPWQNLALLYVRSEQPGRAMAPLDRAIELEPDNAALHAYRGAALRATNRPVEAQDAFERAWRLAPESPDLAIEVARSRQATGDLRASAALRQAIALRPRDANLWAALAGVYRSMQMHTETAAAQRRAIDLGMDTAESWSRLGQILVLVENFAAAVDAFTTAIQRAPEDGWLYYARGDAYYKAGDADAAIDDLARASNLLPGSANPLLSLINIYRVRGDNEQVERLIDRAVATGDAGARVDMAVARLRLDQGRYAEAIDALARVRVNDPDALEAEYFLGRALLKSGASEEGRAVLAEYQAKLDARNDAAEDKLRGDIQQRVTAYGLRSRVFFNEGRYDKALEPLRAALALAPEDEDVWSLLLQVHEARGDRQAAAQARARLAQLQATGQD